VNVNGTRAGNGKGTPSNGFSLTGKDNTTIINGLSQLPPAAQGAAQTVLQGGLLSPDQVKTAHPRRG
jgi:hypothetical protein